MMIELTYQETIENVNRQFQLDYSFLKLEFSNLMEAGHRKQLPGSTLLGDVTGVLREGEIAINPEYTVKQVEQTFKKKFGLPVKIVRKQKEGWVEIGNTDSTLKEQNDTGRKAFRKLFYQADEQF